MMYEKTIKINVFLFQLLLIPFFIRFHILKIYLILDTVFLQCQFTFSTHYLTTNIQTFFIAATFSSKPFCVKTSLPVKNSYLLTFTDDNAEILAVYLSKSYWAIFHSILLSIVLIFSVIVKFFLNLNGLSDDKVVSITKTSMIL